MRWIEEYTTIIFYPVIPMQGYWYAVQDDNCHRCCQRNELLTQSRTTNYTQGFEQVIKEPFFMTTSLWNHGVLVLHRSFNSESGLFSTQ